MIPRPRSCHGQSQASNRNRAESAAEWSSVSHPQTSRGGEGRVERARGWDMPSPLTFIVLGFPLLTCNLPPTCLRRRKGDPVFMVWVPASADLETDSRTIVYLELNLHSSPTDAVMNSQRLGGF